VKSLLRYTKHLSRKYVVGIVDLMAVCRKDLPVAQRSTSAPRRLSSGGTECNTTNTVISELADSYLRHQLRATISNEEERH
jgi:hypothetical protein